MGQVFVGARCFKVTEHFLEELPKALGRRMRTEGAVAGRIRDVFSSAKKKIDQKHCHLLDPRGKWLYYALMI